MIVIVSPDNVTHVYREEGRTECGRNVDERWTIAYPTPDFVECKACRKAAK